MAWWLVDSVMNGTLDEEYPIMNGEYDVPKQDSAYPVRLKDDCYPTVQSVDDAYQYHYPPINNEVNQSENMSAHYFKYHEEEILKDIESYVSGTYRGHYTGDTHEYRNVQTLDLMAARSLASAFCQSNILKYGSRYGSKDGKEKKDLMKVIHYAMLLLHFDEHYGKPSMTSGNIDHNMP